MEVVTRPTDDDYSQVSPVPPFRLHQSYSLTRKTRSRQPQDNIPVYEGPATMSGSRVEATSSALTTALESCPPGFPLCICACGVRGEELRKYRSHFSAQDNARFTLRMLIPWASFCGQLGQTPTRGRRPEGKS